MEIKTWKLGMSDKETADIAYWERNMLALYLADGWYNDFVETPSPDGVGSLWVSRYEGWRRVLSCFGGAACFHIPDDFDVMNLPHIERNWDGHTTEEKWNRLLDVIQNKWQGRANVTPKDLMIVPPGKRPIKRNGQIEFIGLESMPQDMAAFGSEKVEVVVTNIKKPD